MDTTHRKTYVILDAGELAARRKIERHERQKVDTAFAALTQWSATSAAARSRDCKSFGVTPGHGGCTDVQRKHDRG